MATCQLIVPELLVLRSIILVICLSAYHHSEGTFGIGSCKAAMTEFGKGNGSQEDQREGFSMDDGLIIALLF
jgi:hypothetical protein